MEIEEEEKEEKKGENIDEKGIRSLIETGQIKTKTVNDLKDICKFRDIRTKGMKKSDMIEAIKASMGY